MFWCSSQIKLITVQAQIGILEIWVIMCIIAV